MSLELAFRNVTRHAGRYQDFLKRYERVADEAVEAGTQNSEGFCQNLLDWTANERNLMAAADHLRDNGGTAPGPDGIRLADYSSMGLWDLVRELSHDLRFDEYVRGPLERRLVPKDYGSSEKRAIWLMNNSDRIVTRGAAQILTPLVRTEA